MSNMNIGVDPVKMNSMNADVDPLGTYDYPAYDNYNNIHSQIQYNYDVKLENPMTEYFQSYMNVNAHNENNATKLTEMNTENNGNGNDSNGTQTNVTDEDVKPCIKSMKKIKKEKNGRKSSYWSEKISDDSFAFYGCAVCNVSYKALHELDQHVTVHKDRITSYALKIKNQKKRKKLKKEKKKLLLEIKPEDGYIGNEKASEFNCNVTNQPDNDGHSLQSDIKSDNANTVNAHNDSEISTNGLNENTVKDSVNSDTKNGIKENCPSGNGNSSKSNGNGKQTDINLEKIYKCFACQKQFSLSYYLKLHVRSHTDEKPYTCSVCGQSFITASKLGRHNKRIHLAIRYQCRICYRFFSRFEFLTKHFDKKHPEDKLEGEPYDYNAILPYLKELEEQLKEKAESEDTKPKTEDLWEDWPPPPPDTFLEGDNKNYGIVEPLDIIVDEIKVDNDIQIKKECDDEPLVGDAIAEPISEEPMADDGTAGESEDVKEESFNDDNASDDDYFPHNSWALTPKEESGPLSPTQTRSKTDGPLQCKICQKSISTSSYMRIHMRTHTGEKPFKCYICNRGFITSSKMHRHVLTHSESWEDETGIDVKMEAVKSEDDDGTSDEKKPADKKSLIKKAKAKFAKKSKKKSEKKAEKNRASQRRPHACQYCHKRFLHLETLQVHKKSHEGEDLVLKCNFCLEEAADDDALRAHEATHTGPSPYLCTICGKSYKRRETMVYHRKHHKSEKEYICDICSKTFNAPCKLQRHIVSHRVDKFVLRYECPVCAHMFNTKYHIQMHLVTHQKEGLIIEENRNDILAMVLQNARKIPKYTDGQAPTNNMIPPDERSRVCNICGEVFQHFYYLEEHLKSHGSKIAIEDITRVEEKKHVCQVCNKSFKLHYYLKLHSFTHTKEKPYICQQCGKGFITKGKLKRHLETHSGLKKFQCHICYKFFTRTSYLRIHIRTIHGTQDYNFRLGKEYTDLGSLGGVERYGAT
ncbi:uncharacterized protein ACR2FA_007273 [Aphomia sociella]